MNLLEQSLSPVLLRGAHNGLLVNWPFDSDAHPPTANWDLINEVLTLLALPPRSLFSELSEVGVCFPLHFMRGEATLWCARPLVRTTRWTMYVCERAYVHSLKTIWDDSTLMATPQLPFAFLRRSCRLSECCYRALRSAQSWILFSSCVRLQNISQV